MKKIKTICEICKEKKIRKIAFYWDGEPHIYIPLGRNIFMCKECYLSYLSQFSGCSNKEINSFIRD